jgi:hypothetical protein
VKRLSQNKTEVPDEYEDDTGQGTALSSSSQSVLFIIRRYTVYVLTAL